MVGVISAIEKNEHSTLYTSNADIKSKIDAFDKISDEIIQTTWFNQKYTKSLISVTEKYEKKVLVSPTGAIHKMYLFYESMNVIIFQLYALAIKKTTELGKTILAAYSKGMKHAEIVARFITFGGSYIFWYLLKKYRNRPKSLLEAEGVHLLVATMGGGKSSVMFDVMESLRLKHGFGSSINVNLEREKYNKLTNTKILYHDYFDMWDKFGLIEEVNAHGETRYTATLREQFDPNFLGTLVFDEFISALNRRNNKTGDYNKVFLAIFNLVIHKRHINKKLSRGGIKRVYFLQQIDALDGLLDSSINYKHHIQVDLDCTYAEWLLTGMFTRHIIGWDVYSYVRNDRKNFKKATNEWILKKHVYRKRTFNEDEFESHNMGDFYEKLPEAKTKYNKEVKPYGFNNSN